jgi:hypothetical protein
MFLQQKNDDEDIKIVANGNGVIMCALLKDFPDFSTYLIPECIDQTDSPVTR